MGDDKTTVNDLLNKTNLKSSSPIFFIDEDNNPLSEEKLKVYTGKTLDLIITELNRKPDLIRASIVLKGLNETKKNWYPATQKNITANVGIFDEHLKKWLEVRKQLPSNSIEQINLEVKEVEQEIENGN